MVKIMHAQTVLTEDDIEALKTKTGESNTKEAIAKAVSHYLECEYTKVEDMIARKLEKVRRRKQNEEGEENTLYKCENMVNTTEPNNSIKIENVVAATAIGAKYKKSDIIIGYFSLTHRKS